MNKGIQFELWVKQKFESAGCEAELTKTSNDYGVDLLVSYLDYVLAVQCKAYSKRPVGIRAVQEVYAGARFYRARRGAVIVTSRFTAQARLEAETVGVVLIDNTGLDDIRADETGHIAILDPTGFADDRSVFVTVAEAARRYRLSSRQVVKYLIPQGLPVRDGLMRRDDLREWEAGREFVYTGSLLENRIWFRDLPELE